MEHKPLIIYDLRFTIYDLDYSAPLAREFGGGMWWDCAREFGVSFVVASLVGLWYNPPVPRCK